jgi:short-subunit dehydrogenase
LFFKGKEMAEQKDIPGKHNKMVLVTGGGNGIGRELCRCFHKAGCSLVVVSLVLDELVNLKDELKPVTPGQKVIIVQKDLSGLDAAESIFAYCEKEKLDVDILVNNVGYGLAGRHLDLDPARVKQMVVLNMMTMTVLCQLFGKKMKERGRGRILNVASTISFQPLPFWAAYAGTKAYVSSFTQAFAREMKEFGVAVTCLYPGTTATNFLDSAGLVKTPKRWSVGSLVHGAAMDAKKVARAGYRGVMKKRSRVIPGLTNKLHFCFIHWVPNRLISAVVNGFMKRYRRPA